MQNLTELRKSFVSFRESQPSSNLSTGITPDLLFEDSMVAGILSQLLSDIKVNVKIESAFGEATNIPDADNTSQENKIRIERDEYNVQHAFGLLTTEQKIELINKRTADSIEQQVHEPSAAQIQVTRSKFVLIFALFAISAKQQQASLSKDFFKQLGDYLQSCKPVEQRVQMGLDFACQFQLSAFDLLPTDDAKIHVLKKMYELLRQSEDGALFGYDKISFIIDQNLNQMTKYLQSLLVKSPNCRHLCIKVLMQLGRVRCNPADYLSCVISRTVDDQAICLDLSSEMSHISRDLHLKKTDKNSLAKQVSAPTKTSVKFTESCSLNRGILYFYKAGEQKLDITSQDQFVTNGVVLYHFKRGKGLFKLGVGDGLSKVSGIIKCSNTSDAMKSMEPSAMFLLGSKLYIRDYCQSPCPFQVFDSETLEIDTELSEKWKLHFEGVQKTLEKPPAPVVVAEANQEAEVVVHRSLLWHKDSKSGRTLEIAPVFTDGTFVYCISYQKQIAHDKPQMLVLESYDASKNFEFVKSQILFQNDECDPFIYDNNSLQFLRSAQFMTNGTILIMNVPNANIYFFDMHSGKKVGQEKSEHILMAYAINKNKFFTIRSISNNQVLYEVAFENLYQQTLSLDLHNEESFNQVEAKHLQSLLEVAGLTSHSKDVKVESLMEQIVFGGSKSIPVHEDLQQLTQEQVHAQHTLILKYLDLKREQAAEKLPTSDFIKIFKHPNVTYLTGTTFSILITAAAQFKDSQYDLLYILRLLQCNFTALIMCQGSLPTIMRDFQSEYDNFFVLYNSVLRNKVYEKPQTPVEVEIQRVCIEIMASSINILYKNKQEIVDKFLSELEQNPDGINCSIFFDYFSQAENCEKLLAKEIKGTEQIFKETCKVQLKYTQRQLKANSSGSKSEYSACKFMKQYAQRMLVAYCDQLQRVAERPQQISKLPQQLQDKFNEEDQRLYHLQEQVFAIYEALSDSLNECLRSIDVASLPKDKKLLERENNRLQELMLHKSPFAQLHLCLYTNVFTAVDTDAKLLSRIFEHSLQIMTSVRDLNKSLSETGIIDKSATNQKLFNWLNKFFRTLAYLVSVKAYRLVKAEQKPEVQSSVEQQLIQTSLLSGGIDEYFELQFSEQARLQAATYSQIWKQQQTSDPSPYHDILTQIIENQPGSEIANVIKMLQTDYVKKEGPKGMAGGQDGLKLALCAFASILKLQDQVHLFQYLVDVQDLTLMEPVDSEQLTQIFHYASKIMRPWMSGIKNELSERINSDVEQKFRKEKQDKIDAGNIAKVVVQPVAEIQIDTVSESVEQVQSSFFTQEEKDLIQQEQDRIFDIELKKIFDSVVDKAKYLIKLQPPLTKSQSKSDNQSAQSNELLSTWRQMQKDKGSLKSVSYRKKEVLQSFSKEVITILQLPCEVSRIVKQVEDVYIAAHRRAAGLHLFKEVIQLAQDSWSRQTFIESLAWMTSALRQNTKLQVHYLDSLKGCGRGLEEAIRNNFFSVLSFVVKALNDESNSEAEVELFLNALKWRFSGRDHQALGSLHLFETLHKSKKLHTHWGKPIATDFESVNRSRQLKFKFTADAQNQAELNKIFVNLDGDKDGKLNHPECRDFCKVLCEKYGVSTDVLSAPFDDFFNKQSTGDRITFEVLYKNIQFKTTRSNITKQIISLFEQLFSSAVSRLIESDIGASLSFQQNSQLARAKSIINQNSSEVLLQEMFEVIFSEFNRYIDILKLKPGIDWTIYAQQRTKMQDLTLLSVEEYSLIDEDQGLLQDTQLPVQPVEEVKDESEEQRKVRLVQQELKRLEVKAKTEISLVPRFYQEGFLIRLLRLIDLFASVSASQPNLLSMAQRIANPAQISVLLSLLVQASPKIKYLVIRIISSLITMKLPYELFEESINLQLSQSDSIVQQLFKKVQPAIKFKRNKFLALLHNYILSIRQKVWAKSAVESEGQYEISCELLKLMRSIYESQESDQHPWRAEMNEIFTSLFTDIKTLNRPREIEVLLSLIRGSDFSGVAPYAIVEHGKEKLQVLGFVSHDWLKRDSGNFPIEETMKREDLAVLVVETNKDAQNSLKLISPAKLNLAVEDEDKSKKQFALTADFIKKLLGNLDLSTLDSNDDVQQLNNKCMVLKLLDSQLQLNPKKFLSALKESGHYESLLRFVCKESSNEIKGSIIPIEWLEQCCFNIRKQACENQQSLLKMQETQMKLVGDKIYAAVLNPNQDHDKQYTRVQLLLAFNHKAFAQRKDIKLVNGSEICISLEDEAKVEQQVALVEPGEFTDGNAIQILSRSLGVITYEADLQQLVSMLRSRNQTENLIEDFELKTIFVVSREDYERLQAVCTGQSGSTKPDSATQEKKRFDDEFVDSLVKYGGFSQLVAAKTKPIQGVEQKTKFLFDLLKQIKDGSIQLNQEEEAIEIRKDTVVSDILPECQVENRNILACNFRDINNERYDQENDRQPKPIEGRFFANTKIEDNADLASLYEEKIKRLFNMYCRHIFWSLIQKDKIESMFDFLLTTPEDIKSFVTFIKVVGNESYITANQDHIKNFKSFVKQVVQVSIKNEKFQPVLTVITNDLIDSYRKSLSELLGHQSPISELFMTENQASAHMNPFVVLPIIKYTMAQGGFNLIKDRIEDLISILLTINSAFFGENVLKDKYWLQIIQILDKCYELPTQKIELICKLPLLQALFTDFAEQNQSETQETLFVQSKISRGGDFDLNQCFKQVFEHRQKVLNSKLIFNQKKPFQLVQVEVIYKFFRLSQKVPNLQFFFTNNLTAYLQMRGQLIKEAVDGPLSKHLMFLNSLPVEKSFISNQHVVDFQTMPVFELQNNEAYQMFFRVKQSSQIKLWQRLIVSTDREGRNQIANLNQKEIEKGFGFGSISTEKAFVQVAQPQQNFTIDLALSTFTVQPSQIKTEGQILQKQDSRIETSRGIYRFSEEDKFSKSNTVPIKDHLKFKQVNFGKDCIIALLPNGNVIGFGNSKHRHFVDKGSCDSHKDDDVIPLVVKPTETQQTPEEKQAQREILTIQTYKRTTVCVTKAGQVYACGDKFAKNIKLSVKNPLPFGFYQLPIDMNPAVAKPAEPVKEEKPEEPKALGIAELFGENNEPSEEKVVEEEKKEDPDQSFKSAESVGEEDFKSSKSHDDTVQETAADSTSEPVKTLSHSAEVTNLAEAVKLEEVELQISDQVVADVVAEEIAPAEEESKEVEAGLEQNQQLNEDSNEEEYVPKPEEEVKLPVVEQPQILKAEQVWISKTASSKSTVVLALFKTQDGYQFRTIGNNTFGLLGQGKDVKQSHEFRVVDFGIPLQQVDEVVVGQNHFLVRAEGKIFAWGCYSTDSEERMLWKPQELTFFSAYKVKSLKSGNMVTVALVEQIGGSDYFICGKFAPLWNENTYKSLKEFQNVEIDQNFLLDGGELYVSVKEAAEIDLKEAKVEIETAQNFSFQPNTKIYEANDEAYKKFEELLVLPETAVAKKSELINLIETYIFSRVKNNQFEEIQWKDIPVSELKIDESLGLSDEQKQQWLLLVVNYCRHLWGYLSYINGKMSKYEGMEILTNFIKNRSNVPLCLKNKLLQNIIGTLPKDDNNKIFSIHVARLKAKEFKAQGKVDSKFEWTVFSKVSDVLRKADFKGMRQNNPNMKGWFMKFISESSNDDGGLFRESITEFCLELQSSCLELFVPCGNQANKIGENRDQWLINPKASSKLHLRKFFFIGCMFGMCVRSGILMNLNLTRTFWKRLTGEKVTEDDIRAIDNTFMNNLDLYLKKRQEGLPEEQFISEFQLYMQGSNSGQEMIDLIENGSKVPVTYANLDQYVKKCIQVRLSESKAQFKSIIDGFDHIFRQSYLKMISWNELEIKIVGNEEIDIERLKEMSEYHYCNTDSQIVKRFWRVLASFDNQDKQRYLRFVWGRVRLPPKEQTEVDKHKIQVEEQGDKNKLPFGRTCYFRIELPNYPTEAILREKLLFAIHNTGSIDGDHNNISEETGEVTVNHDNSDNSDDEELRRDRERMDRARQEEAHRNQDYGSEEEE